MAIVAVAAKAADMSSVFESVECLTDVRVRRISTSKSTRLQCGVSSDGSAHELQSSDDEADDLPRAHRAGEKLDSSMHESQEESADEQLCRGYHCPLTA